MLYYLVGFVVAVGVKLLAPRASALHLAVVVVLWWVVPIFLFFALAPRTGNNNSTT